MNETQGTFKSHMKCQYKYPAKQFDKTTMILYPDLTKQSNKATTIPYPDPTK